MASIWALSISLTPGVLRASGLGRAWDSCLVGRTLGGGQKRQELDCSAKSFSGHAPLPSFSFPSGKPGQALPAPTLSGIRVLAQSLVQVEKLRWTERALGGNPQRIDSAKRVSPILPTTELNANKPEWYSGRCRMEKVLRTRSGGREL